MRNSDRLKEALIRRRPLLIAPFAFFGLVALSSWRSPEEVASADSEEEFPLVRFDDRGRPIGPAQAHKIVKPDSVWKKSLSAESYYVTRRKSTDTPYTGSYYQMHDAGLFRCICCRNALFSSAAKYDSGTGWPSFFEPIAVENIRTVKDVSLLMERVEVLCRECDAHLGHVFPDGPPPTGQRYCMNESALRFVPLATS